MELEFEWDEDKARANLAKHRVSFLTAAEVFSNDILERIDDREDYGELRFIAPGRVDIQVFRVVFPWRGEDLIRIISPRKRAGMKVRSTIVRHSLSQIKAMREHGEDQTASDAPEAESLGAEFWKNARVVMPAGKTSVHLRLDSDVVEWFKARGKGHLTRMNAVLRAYVDAHHEPPSRN